MLKSINPTKTKAYSELQILYNETKNFRMKDMFKADAERFNKYSIGFENIVFDYSKNIITDETKQKLIDHANECDLTDGIKQLFAGEAINQTEGRPVMHTALRSKADSVIINGKNVMPIVNEVLKKMKVFSYKIISGEWKGYTGKSNYRCGKYWNWWL